MRTIVQSFVFALGVANSGFAAAQINIGGFKWDPVGDFTHPERIVRNVGREAGNAGAAIDRARIEAQSQAGAPVLEQWLIESRNTAMRGGAQPIPTNIRQRLSGFFDDDLLNRVRFKVGDNGVLNLANLSIRCKNVSAVTLIDVVVFRDENDAFNNDVLWAHEMHHVQQFRDWGTRDFAIRYLRSWDGVENDATSRENAYESRGPAMFAGENRQVFAPPPLPQSFASMCMTPYGNCGMAVAIPVNAQCMCPTMNGPIFGMSR